MVRPHERDSTRRLTRGVGARRPWWAGHPAPRRPVAALEWEAAGSRAVVRVRGELGPQLELLVAGRSLAGCRELEIDLAGVGAIGSSGLSALLGIRRWCLQRHIALRLRDVQPSVWRVVELAGLDQAFPVPGELPAGQPQELALF